ncbi:KPN_02809 family neutral zinc metallopeptidase [Limnoglobus roseus]|uniref:Putative metalloprotease n=1 Tax=Limnoglobus roseus TaxID=2598579 RepID=A0A5C1AL02_9BACT|nr:neutral zinc metallopeptidase [Limnoglobus roseus]QEL18833.1 putative metalloprotease [Limnoglobus roseus]
MDWSGQSESSNVEDRRGAGPAVAAGGGMLTIVAVALAYFLGIDPNQAKQVADKIGGRMGEKRKTDTPPTEDEHYHFARKVLGSTEEVWDAYFRDNYRKRYEHPGMVLFSESVDSGGCGTAPSAVGPFYCPVSRKVFLDPTFFDELEKKLGGDKGDASRAYVVAHEVGHHVQNLLGYNTRVEEFRKREGENGGIRLELQADYLAGVWANQASKKNPNLFNRNDMASIIKTAQAIGDDRIQKKMRGWTSPESFTHGSAAQREKFFMKGFETGNASKEALDVLFNPRVAPLDL